MDSRYKVVVDILTTNVPFKMTMLINCLVLFRVDSNKSLLRWGMRYNFCYDDI